jgi:predicted nucleic-acid-binding Zn-ribbon protein
MTSDRKDIKIKIDELDKEIKLLENKINEMSWQRMKYQEFYEKPIVIKSDH